MAVLHSHGLKSFAEERREQLIQRAPLALLSAAVLIGVYNGLAAALASSWLPLNMGIFVAEAGLPLVGVFILRLPAVRAHAELALLLLYCVFTTIGLGELALPSPDTVGLGLSLALVLTGSALVIPWTPGWQALAAGYTALAFPLAMLVTGTDLGSRAVAAPYIGAVLSVIGALLLESHRRASYEHQVALAESEETYRSLTEGTVAGVFVYQDDRFRFVNEACARFLGYTRDDLTGRSNEALHRPEDLAVARGVLAELLSGQRDSVDSVLRAYRSDGSEVYGRASFSRIRYDHRPAVLGVLIDVTAERQQQEQAARLAAEVRVSEARYRDLFENSTDLIIETDATGRVTAANGAALALTGYPRTSLDGHLELATVLTPDGLAAVRQFRRDLLAGLPGQQPLLVELVAADSSRHIIEVQTRVIQHPGGPVMFQSIGRDVTERQRLLVQTEQLVAFQRALTAMAPSLHGPHGLDETCARITEVCRGLFGVSSVYLWYREGDSLVGRGASGAPLEPFLNSRFPLSEPRSFTAQALQEKRPIYFNHLTASEWRLPPIDRLGAQAWMSVPLLADGEPLGALVLIEQDNPGRFNAQSVDWGRIFASQAVLAIENARLRDRERTEAHLTSMLLKFAQALHARLGDPELRQVLADRAAAMLECEATGIVEWHPDGDRFQLAYVYGLTDEQRAELEGIEVAPQGRAAFSGGAAQFSRAAVTTPLIAALLDRCNLSHVLYLPIRHERSFLAMLVFGRRDDRPFSAASVRLAERLAYYAATALENARLLDAIQAANRLKSDFLATMSHELRSPLNVIMGYTDLLRDAQFGEVTPEQAQILERVLHQSRQLLDLINTTLDLSRLERGEIRVSRERFVLSDLFTELQAELAPRVSPALAVHWHAVNGLPPLRTDRGKLKLIVRNLVDNAIKFTEDGSVDIAAEAADGRTTIYVRDTGRGIPADALSTIFEMFRQVDAGDSRMHGGVGLGLYIVQRLVSMLDGTVEVESTPGIGSTFRVTLPIEKAAAPRAPQPGSGTAQFA